MGGRPVSSGWSIADGVIQRDGIRPGDIITKEHYSDFELRFEWKISERGNSGVKYRTRGSLGPEYQVLDDERHPDAGNPARRAASLYDLVPAAADKPVRPPGQWNEGRIVARGSRIEHWLNGAKVLEAEIGSDEWDTVFQKSKYRKHDGFGSWTGPILLQDHMDKVWYRNVKIRER